MNEHVRAWLEGAEEGSFAREILEHIEYLEAEVRRAQARELILTEELARAEGTLAPPADPSQRQHVPSQMIGREAA